MKIKNFGLICLTCFILLSCRQTDPGYTVYQSTILKTPLDFQSQESFSSFAIADTIYKVPKNIVDDLIPNEFSGESYALEHPDKLLISMQIESSDGILITLSGDVGGCDYLIILGEYSDKYYCDEPAYKK